MSGNRSRLTLQSLLSGPLTRNLASWKISCTETSKSLSAVADLQL